MNSLKDKQAFDVLFKSHYKDLARFAYSYVNDEEVAKEIVHNAFLMLWRNWWQMDHSRPMRPYLLTLCRNKSLDYLKHLRVMRANECELSDYLQQEAEDTGEYEKRLEQVREKLEELPERQREVLVKCFVQGKKYKEIAQELGITVNSVKTHITRGLNKMRGDLLNDLVLFYFLKR